MVQQCLKRAIVRNRPKSDTYAIANWMRHFCGIHSDEDLKKAITEVNHFLGNDNYFLQWIDILATHGLLSEAAILLQRVNTFLKNKVSRPYTQPQSNCLKNIQQALWLLNFRHSASPQKELSPKYSLPFLPSDSKLRLTLLEKAFPWLEVAPNTGSDFAQSGTLHNGHMIWCCCYSPDGRMIVTGGHDGVVRFWDVETFKVQQAFTTSSFVRQVLFTKNHLLIALSGLAIYIWDKDAGKLLKALPTSSPCFGFSTKHNQLIATQGEELTLFNFPLGPTGDWMSSTALSIEKGSMSSVGTMSVSPDGELMAYTMDSKIFIWNIESKKIHRLFDEHTSSIDGLAWRGSKYLASASEDKTVRIWATNNDNEENSEEGKVANSLCVLAGHSDKVKCVSFSSDGSRLASGSYDRTIRIWILKESDQTQYELWKVLFGHSGSIFSLDFDPYQQQQLISSSSDMTVRVWAISTLEKADADQEEPRQPPSPSPLNGHSTAIILIVFSPDGRLFASASTDGKICLWDCVKGNIIGSFEEHKMHITSLSFSDSGNILVSACKDGTARVWDTNSMTIKYRLWGHDDWVRCAVVSPNETLVASASDDKSVRVWELSSLPAARAENNYPVETKHRRFGGHEGHEDFVCTITFSKGGYLASGGDDLKILIWNLQGTGDRTKPDISIDNASEESIRGLSFTEDEKRIASCDAGGVVRILNLETKMCEHILASEGQPQLFNSIKFIKTHPDLLMTDLGVWTIPKKAIPPSVSACKPEGPVKTALSRKSVPDWCPYGIKHNQEWITWKNKNLIFLPAQFRPSKYEEAACSVQGRKVAIGCDSGQVLFFRFSEKGPYLSRSDSL